MKKIDRTGEINKSFEGYLMKIIRYKDANNIIIEFQDKNKVKVKTKYEHFKNGKIKNPYHPNVFNVAYIGEGKYKSGINNKKTRCYETWISMLQRCYDPYYLNKQPSYIDCYVCDEWLNFQNFAKWYYKHYYEISNEMMCLDKDILFKGNKIYSPQTCIFVPQRINKLFIKNDRFRNEYPIGVSVHSDNKRLQVNCRVTKKTKYLGCFPLDRPFQAFTCYKQFKENYIKQVADEYKDLIPQKLYRIMYEWKVEIND